MADKFTMKLGDLDPAIKVQLVDGNGDLVNLTGIDTVVFKMAPIDPGNTATPISAPATVIVYATGIVQYAWANGDTNHAGQYRAEFVVSWAGGKEETFPSDRYIPVEIYTEL